MNISVRSFTFVPDDSFESSLADLRLLCAYRYPISRRSSQNYFVKFFLSLYGFQGTSHASSCLCSLRLPSLSQASFAIISAFHPLVNTFFASSFLPRILRFFLESIMFFEKYMYNSFKIPTNIFLFFSQIIPSSDVYLLRSFRHSQASANPASAVTDDTKKPSMLFRSP